MKAKTFILAQNMLFTQSVDLFHHSDTFQMFWNFYLNAI